MDDILKTVIFGLFGLFVVHGSLEKRVSHDATREVQEAFHHTGTVRTTVESRGMFGVFASDIYSIDVYGDGLKTDQLPFVAIPRPGWKGSIRHLRLHLTNLTLKGLPIDRFDADVPFVTYDIGHAAYRDRLVIRGAGTGPASVHIGAEGLRLFLLRKYVRTLSDLQIEIGEGRVSISGRLALLGAPTPFKASGELAPREGRYLDLTSPMIELNGRPMTAAGQESILKQINPVLDISTDLGLGEYITLSRVEIGHGAVTVRGNASIPVNRK